MSCGEGTPGTRFDRSAGGARLGLGAPDGGDADSDRTRGAGAQRLPTVAAHLAGWPSAPTAPISAVTAGRTPPSRLERGSRLA